MIPMGFRVGITAIPKAVLKLFVVFADAVYARGWQALLAELPEAGEIHCVVGFAHARAQRGLRAVDIMLLECELAGGGDFAEELGELPGARVLLCTRGRWNEELASAALTEVGVLAARTLMPEVLTVAVCAVGTGAGALGIDLLGDLSPEGARPAARNGVHRLEHLRQHDHRVLSLKADGIPSRETAQRLAYSELEHGERSARAPTKLKARSRSHAVAMAGARGDHLPVSDPRPRPTQRAHWSLT
jgi:DNA-binding NarL/FixJ family response regulator